MEEKNLKIDLLEAARKILSHELNYIEGCRLITRILRKITIDQNNSKSLSIFEVIDSETDHLPVGHVRKHWNKEILKDRDREIERIYKLYENDLIEGCKKVIGLFNY